MYCLFIMHIAPYASQKVAMTSCGLWPVKFEAIHSMIRMIRHTKHVASQQAATEFCKTGYKVATFA